MANLEERIRSLLETKQVSEEDTLLEGVEDLEEANKVKMDKDGAVEVDGGEDKEDDSEDKESDDKEDDSEESDDQEDDGDTEVSKAKDKAKVEEGTDPFGSLTNTDNQEAGSAKTSKIIPGRSRKDDAGQGKLTDGAFADKQDDAGKTAKIKAKLGAKDSGGKLNVGETSTGAGDENNFSKTNQKIALGEAMTALFSGEELSEEFKTKATTIFEAAVEQAAAEHVAQLQEQYQIQLDEQAAALSAQLEEAVEEVQSELVENVDGFLNHIVEQWVSDNQVALERGMKLELVDSFIDGLKSLFQEHYVDVPEEKLDVIEAQAKQIEELEAAAAELAEERDLLAQQVVEATRMDVMEGVAFDLTQIQREKLFSLCESIEFVSDEEFKQKVETIKESYFPVGRRSENVAEIKEEVSADETMSKYVSAVTKNIRF